MSPATLGGGKRGPSPSPTLGGNGFLMACFGFQVITKFASMNRWQKICKETPDSYQVGRYESVGRLSLASLFCSPAFSINEMLPPRYILGQSRAFPRFVACPHGLCVFSGLCSNASLHLLSSRVVNRVRGKCRM